MKFAFRKNVRRPLFWPLYFFSTLLCGIVAEAQESQNTLSESEIKSAMEAIDVGVRQWRDALNLKCEFRFQQGLALTQNDALQGHFVGGSDKATCRFVKIGEFTLYDFQLEGEGAFDPKTQTSTLDSFFLASGKEVEAFRSGAKGPVVFTDVTSHLVNGLLHRQMLLTNVFPFVKMGGNSGAIFQPMIDSNLFDFSVSRDGHRLDVSATVIKTGSVMNYRFDTSGRYPVLTSFRDADNSGAIAASEFVELSNGCLFPKQFTVVTGPVAVIGSDEERWVSRIWRITDAKILEPTKEDFILAFDDKVRIAGLTLNLPVNLLDLTADSLIKNAADAPPGDTLDDHFVSRSNPQSDLDNIPRNNNSNSPVPKSRRVYYAISGQLNTRLIVVAIGIIVFGGLLYFAAINFYRR